MAPLTRRGVLDCLKGASATLQLSLGTQVVNTHGFPALAHEIYLEIISYLPSLPIPTPTSYNLSSNPDICRSRHDTLLSLSQTSRSLRGFFRHYTWQRIEVREGMKIGNVNDTLKATPYLPSANSSNRKALQNYAIELVRQLEIVTVRNPQLAQNVNYVNVFVVEYSIDKVLAELARCLSLFPNLHTIQIDVTPWSSRDLGKVFKRVFEKRSYPQICNVFVSFWCQSLFSSFPEARRVGCTQGQMLSMPYLRTIIENFPHLEVLLEPFWTADMCQFVVDGLPHLRTVTISPFSSGSGRLESTSIQIELLKRLNHLQTIIILWKPDNWVSDWDDSEEQERTAYLNRLKEEWIEQAKCVLIEIQRRTNNLEKAVVISDGESERRIRIPPLIIRQKFLKLAT